MGWKQGTRRENIEEQGARNVPALPAYGGGGVCWDPSPVDGSTRPVRQETIPYRLPDGSEP
jgi:hypothetical protein